MCHFKNKLLLIAISTFLFALSAELTLAGKPDCENDPSHPKCDDDGGGGDPGDPPGNANPMVAYNTGLKGVAGTYLYNGDGSNPVQILSETERAHGVPRLDAPGQRVLYWARNGAVKSDLVVMTYVNNAGVIEPAPPKLLVPETAFGPPEEVGGTGRGLIDWAPTGDKYAYTYFFDAASSSTAVYRIMVAPIDGSETTTDFNEHIVAWEIPPGGRMDWAAWDASGRYLYIIEPYDPGQRLLTVIDVVNVIDVDGVSYGDVVASVDITLSTVVAGFDEASSFISVTAGSTVGASNGGYSFKPGDGPNTDTALCLAATFRDDTTRNSQKFTIIYDLPSLFDTGSLESCPSATPPTVPILDFSAADFTDSDGVLIGGSSEKGAKGIWTVDLEDGDTRTQVISKDGSVDWSN
jgi:hypothetical protein